MSLAAAIQITDQDTYQQSTVSGAEKIGQYSSTPNGKVFSYSKAGGTLVAGQITEPVVVTANYATRTLTATTTTIGSTQISVPLGTTAAADAFIGFWFVVTDGTGKGQGTYYITGNTAATAGNSNTTLVSITGQLNVALDNTSVVGLFPNQQITLIQHTAVSAIPCGGAPTIAITSGNFFWSQIGGYASVLTDASVPTKNVEAIPSAATAGAVTIDVNTDVIHAIGYAPELMVSAKYSPLVFTLVD